MQKRHVTLERGNVVKFDYRAKGGQRRVQSVVDADVFAVVRELKRRRGSPKLLAYKRGRAWADLRSDDINESVKQAIGEQFSAKDFRTWNATVLAAVSLAVVGKGAHSETAHKRVISYAVKEVAHYLGNTAAVCRASYIDPRLFDRFNDGLTIGGVLDELGEDTAGRPETQGAVEVAVLALLEERLDEPAIERLAVAA
jgi:DNA topoisomerase-1